MNTRRSKKTPKFHTIVNVFARKISKEDHQLETEPQTQEQEHVVDSAKILVILAGGTIIMTKTSQGYKCVKGGFINTIKTYPNLYDSEKAKSSNLESHQLITPLTPDGHRIFYDVLELDDIKDSSNYNVNNHIALAKKIKEKYNQYDAFVLLHGTDTMAYTASSLSFILENLSKPVIITGSQIPLQELRSDALDNFLGSILVASKYLINEVMIYFAHKLLRGNRCTKIDNENVVAFHSHNLPPMGEMGTHMKINWDVVLQNNFSGDLMISESMNNSISIVVVTPFINVQLLTSVFEHSQAIILEAYGAGNLPVENLQFMSLLEGAMAKGTLVVVMSQCNLGSVTDVYETGKVLIAKGAILASDMSKEAVLAKVSYLLGKGLPLDKVKLLMMINMKGELTEKIQIYNQEDYDIYKNTNKFLKYQKSQDGMQELEKHWPNFVNQTIQQGNLALLETIEFDEEVYRQIENFEIAGKFPVHLAALSGKVPTMDFLVRKNFHINKIDADGNSPLFYAIKGKNQDMVKFMENNNARLIISSRTTLSKFLNQIGSQGDLDTLQIVKKYPIDLDFANYNNRNIGHISALEDNENILLFLGKETQFDFNQRDYLGKSVYDYVRNQEVLKQLRQFRQPSQKNSLLISQQKKIA